MAMMLSGLYLLRGAILWGRYFAVPAFRLKREPFGDCTLNKRSRPDGDRFYEETQGVSDSELHQMQRRNDL
ncbi:MAG: hypothetical protein ACLSCX_01365 [Oscillospiraceae bacterium]